VLIFTIKDEDSIYIGRNVTVKILNSRKNRVRVGIEAHKFIPVHRKKIFDKIFLGQENRKILSIGNVINWLRWFWVKCWF
jgi:carbon storage regulator CsrA